MLKILINLIKRIFSSSNKKIDPVQPNEDSTEPVHVEPTDIFISIYEKRAYLRSPQWNKKRKAVLKRDKYTCQSCGVTGVPLDVHHETYANMYNEPLDDLVSVCRMCHKSIHEELGYSYNRTYKIRKP